MGANVLKPELTRTMQSFVLFDYPECYAKVNINEIMLRLELVLYST